MPTPSVNSLEGPSLFSLMACRSPPQIIVSAQLLSRSTHAVLFSQMQFLKSNLNSSSSLAENPEAPTVLAEKLEWAPPSRVRPAPVLAGGRKSHSSRIQNRGDSKCLSAYLILSWKESPVETLACLSNILFMEGQTAWVERHFKQTKSHS